jgi:FtsP/CotA-like multicopper oxidase with cupredoxin domain
LNGCKTPLLVGPTIRLNPSETARITLINNLPDDACVAPQGTHNIPNCFNVTNLHGHGLHVSPVGNGDNVLLEIGPGQSFQYEYNIAADHPAGTYWYHAHRHGSTALQVSSGMAGALVINGNRKPELMPSGALLPGDIDTLLVTTAQGSTSVPFAERVFCLSRSNMPAATITAESGLLILQSESALDLRSHHGGPESSWRRRRLRPVRSRNLGHFRPLHARERSAATDAVARQ